MVWVGAGKGRGTIDRFFTEALCEHQRRQVRWASCDMNRAYSEAIKHHCPNATLVIDHFHVTKALNDAVDEVRKEEWRAPAGEQRKAIKGLRWLLYRHPATRTKGQTEPSIVCVIPTAVFTAPGSSRTSLPSSGDTDTGRRQRTSCAPG